MAQAVAGFEAALEERTRERVPLDWALTKHNLGIALLVLGEHESNPQRLAEAVAAFEAALQEYTRERVPLDWASTKYNLGIALHALGDRENSPDQLAQAAAAYKAALEELTRKHVPLDWARIKTKLAIVLEKLGEIHLASNDRSGARERYQQALAARQELADSDIVDVDQRLDLVPAHYKLAQAGFEKSENVEKAWVILLDLEAAGRLAPEQAEWMWRLLGLEGRHEASKRMEAVLVATEAGEVKAKAGAGEATADRLGQVARYALFASQYGRANTAADRAIGLAPKFNVFFSIYKAHAQFFLARTDRERLLAREFYKQRVGQKVWPSSELWERVIADDFAEFRAAGIDHPLMKEIEADLGIAARPDQPPR